jgi:hypothetical protein
MVLLDSTEIPFEVIYLPNQPCCSKLLDSSLPSRLRTSALLLSNRSMSDALDCIKNPNSADSQADLRVHIPLDRHCHWHLLRATIYLGARER